VHAEITRKINPARRHRTSPRAVKRARHNSYRVKKPDEAASTRHPGPATITLYPLNPDRHDQPTVDTRPAPGPNGGDPRHRTPHPPQSAPIPAHTARCGVSPAPSTAPPPAPVPSLRHPPTRTPRKAHGHATRVERPSDPPAARNHRPVNTLGRRPTTEPVGPDPIRTHHTSTNTMINLS
jgi:hypothetical protein